TITFFLLQAVKVIERRTSNTEITAIDFFTKNAYFTILFSLIVYHYIVKKSMHNEVNMVDNNGGFW
ncbi:MAG: hypothetical protein IKT61_02860, partial [Clostridia bacterium]|nr:hypothetical protein [Clostridia bacterium]